MWRAGALIRLVMRTVIYSLALGTPTTIVFALISAWQSYGSYWPSAYLFIVVSATLGALFSIVAGLIMGSAMVVSIVVSFRRIENRRYFQSLMALTPVCLTVFALLLFTNEESAAAYFRNLLLGPAWIKLHFMASAVVLAGAALLCRAVAGKYAVEVSLQKRKPHA